MSKETKRIPTLRFHEFTEEWKVKRINEIIERFSNPVKVNKDEEYRQIGIRSHGKGIFHKEAVTGKALGNKRVFWIKENLFIVNIVFAWEQAVARTTRNEIGMIASHRFPMFSPINKSSDVDFLLYFFLRKKGKHLMLLASPGGAGRNKTLGQQRFEKLKITIPTLQEQKKIVVFLASIDEKINQLTKRKDLLEKYKKGVMQKIFGLEIRFKDDKGKHFAKWKEKKLGDICHIKTGKKDVINKVENGIYPFFVRSANVESINTYSYDGEAILIPGDGKIGEVFHYINGKFDYHQRVYKISDAKKANLKFVYFYMFEFFYRHAMSFTVKATVDSLRLPIIKSFSIKLPPIEEQEIIANFLSAIDDKINLVNQELDKTQEFKKGLLQQMFV